MALHKVAVAAKDGQSSPVAIPGGVQQHDTSGTGAGPNVPLLINVDSAGNEIHGLTTDAASTATDATPISAASVRKQISASIQVIAGAISSAKMAVKAAAADFADGAITTLGLKADAASTATDTTAVTAMSVFKQISKSIQALFAAFGAQADATWDGSAAASSISIFRYIGVKLEAVRAAIVAATLDRSIPLLTTGVTAVANGATVTRVNSAASTNATNLKTSAGQVYSVDLFNTAAYTVFLKWYDATTNPPVPGTTTVKNTVPIPAGGSYSKYWPNGSPFGAGIGFSITKLQADSDTTAIAAGDVVGEIEWI